MLDLDHLSRQTLGNRALEREVLGLFVSQIEDLVIRLRDCRDQLERRDAAHTIVGSASAIGAFDIARIAAQIERADGAVDDEVDELVAVISGTCAFIVDRLER